MEVDVAFQSRDGWTAWQAGNPWSRDPARIRARIEAAVRHGIVSPFLGPVAPAEIELGGTNFRESFRARGLNPRARAILDLVAELPEAAASRAVRIFAPEALSPLALALRGRFPRFLGTEYVPDEQQRRRLYPIPHEDLTRLSFRDESFDLTITNDVFEHVPSLPDALGELARVLRPGGVLIAVFPFAYDRDETIVKAVQHGDRIEHLAEPEYHADPLDPRGALVYQIPAWDILELARKQGFRSAEMRFVSSQLRGITATELAGIFLMRAQR